MNNLKLVRKDNSITQFDLAKIVNVKQNTISNWESGRSEIDQDNLIKICNYFNVSTDYLLGRESKEEPQLGQQESNLLKMFSQLSELEKIKLLSYLEGMLAAKGKTEYLFKNR